MTLSFQKFIFWAAVLCFTAMPVADAQVSMPFPGPSGGAPPISFVRTANNGFNSGTFSSGTLSFDGTGCGILVISVIGGGASGTPTSRAASFNAVVMTEIPTSIVSSAVGSIQSFSLVSPASGVNTISVSWSTVSYSRQTIGAWCFSGGTNTISSVKTANGTTATAAVTSDAQSFVLAAQQNANGTASTISSPGGATSDWAGNVGGGYGASGAHMTGAASVTPTWSATEDNLVAFSIK